MFTVIVSLRIRPDKVETFLRGIRDNAHASLRDEPGCLRFDVHRTLADPHRFVLHEIYTDEQAFFTAHRSAPHYAAWRAVAAECVEEGEHVNTFCEPMFAGTGEA
ncbi:putative quinol monooxygenase [Prauserella flavalba]|uniref:putative quinol monooxygenase n=1 Tax=Prauserella flavalba TaxID=1477506 RepID=UPI0036ED7F59